MKISPPRGKLITPEEVQRRYLLREDGTPMLSTRWVCDNVRPRVDIARGVVKFYEEDVEAFFAQRRRVA